MKNKEQDPTLLVAPDPKERILDLNTYVIGDTGEIADLIHLSEETESHAAAKLDEAVRTEWTKDSPEFNMLEVVKTIFGTLTADEAAFYAVMGIRMFVDDTVRDLSNQDKAAQIMHIIKANPENIGQILRGLVD